MTIQDLAKQVLVHFETGKRESTGETFKFLNSVAPEWMNDLMREAHDGMLPDDHRYQMIHEILEVISNADDLDEAIDGLEADIYNKDLLAWVGSALHRAEYVNEAVNQQLVDVSSGFDLFKTLQAGQIVEKQEIYHELIHGLETQLAGIEE